MTDHFALLDEARVAWLDVEALKNKFHERARGEHPDAGGRNFQALNVAYRVLADPKSRLAHLLELNGAKLATIKQPPADLVDLFFKTANALKGPKDAIDSHLARVTLLRDRVIDSLRTLEVGDIRQLSDAHQRLAFLDRWIAQLREAVL